jgi:hypothetical protein
LTDLCRARGTPFAVSRWPADANRRILYVNPVLWRAVKIEGARDRRTVSAWVSVLCEKALGWADEDEE